MQKPTAAHSEASDAAQRGSAGSFLTRVSRVWRIGATAVGFTFFGLLSVLIALTAMPLLRCLPGTSQDKEIRSQRAMHYFVRVYLSVLEILQVGRFESVGGAKLREPGQLVVANHPSLLDVILLISLMPQADCVIKGSYIKHPLLGGAARGAGFIPNWEGPNLVEECAERLIQGRSVIIFPEGTRSPVGELGRFARGAAHIALRSGRDPVPVTIRCDPATLYRGKAWWDVPHRMLTLSARVGDPLLVKDHVTPTMSPALAARALTKSLQEHFEAELASADSPWRDAKKSNSVRHEIRHSIPSK
jgi:1-acyl-sn-glycerol-3-phosphate acyltransferase